MSFVHMVAADLFHAHNAQQLDATGYLQQYLLADAVVLVASIECVGQCAIPMRSFPADPVSNK